jgi:hypothetical protein
LECENYRWQDVEKCLPEENLYVVCRYDDYFLQNVYEFVKSYHFDDSDSQIDYFHTNFYLNFNIGSDTHPYKIVIPKLKGRKSDIIPQFKHPEGQAHKAIRQVLGKNRFAEYQSRG